MNCPVVVNTDAYNALSDAHREALDSSIEPAIQHYLDNYGKLLDKWESILAEKGVQKIEFTDDQIAEFRAAAADPVREQWLKDMEAAGVPGAELYQLVKDTLGK